VEIKLNLTQDQAETIAAAIENCLNHISGAPGSMEGNLLDDPPKTYSQEIHDALEDMIGQIYWNITEYEEDKVPHRWYLTTHSAHDGQRYLAGPYNSLDEASKAKKQIMIIATTDKFTYDPSEEQESFPVADTGNVSDQIDASNFDQVVHEDESDQGTHKLPPNWENAPLSAQVAFMIAGPDDPELFDEIKADLKGEN